MDEAGLSTETAFSPGGRSGENKRNETAVKPLKTHDCAKSSISQANDFNDLWSLSRRGCFRSTKSPFRLGGDAVNKRIDTRRFAAICASIGTGR
jgi:hypothetical protein